eukprot:EG_transcript_4950
MQFSFVPSGGAAYASLAGGYPLAPPGGGGYPLAPPATQFGYALPYQGPVAGTAFPGMYTAAVYPGTVPYPAAYADYSLAAAAAHPATTTFLPLSNSAPSAPSGAGAAGSSASSPSPRAQAAARDTGARRVKGSGSGRATPDRSRPEGPHLASPYDLSPPAPLKEAHYPPLGPQEVLRWASEAAPTTQNGPTDAAPPLPTETLVGPQLTAADLSTLPEIHPQPGLSLDPGTQQEAAQLPSDEPPAMSLQMSTTGPANTLSQITLPAREPPVYVPPTDFTDHSDTALPGVLPEADTHTLSAEEEASIPISDINGHATHHPSGNQQQAVAADTQPKKLVSPRNAKSPQKAKSKGAVRSRSSGLSAEAAVSPEKAVPGPRPPRRESGPKKATATTFVEGSPPVKAKEPATASPATPTPAPKASAGPTAASAAAAAKGKRSPKAAAEANPAHAANSADPAAKIGVIRRPVEQRTALKGLVADINAAAADVTRLQQEAADYKEQLVAVANRLPSPRTSSTPLKDPPSPPVDPLSPPASAPATAASPSRIPLSPAADPPTSPPPAEVLGGHSAIPKSPAVRPGTAGPPKGRAACPEAKGPRPLPGHAKVPPAPKAAAPKAALGKATAVAAKRPARRPESPVRAE